MIIFEEILPAHRWIIGRYLSIGRDIRFIRLNGAVKTREWLQDLVKSGRIKKIELDLRVNTFDGLYYDRAFEAVEIFFKHLKGKEVMDVCRRLYGDEHIALVFKKSLNERLARFYYLNHALNRLKSAYKDEDIAFIPHLHIELYHDTDGCEIDDYRKFYKEAGSIGAPLFNSDGIIFPVWAQVLSAVFALKRRIKAVFNTAAFFFWVFAASAKSFVRAGAIKKRIYKYAVMITSPRRQFTNGIQKVDFLIDDYYINKRDTVFISNKRLDAARRDYMRKNGLDYIDDITKFISVKDVWRILPAYAVLASAIFRTPGMVSDAGLKALYFYLIWNALARDVKIKKLITHAEYGQQSIARNIVLRHHGCESYYYLDAINLGYFFTKDRASIKYRHGLFGFLLYDNLISWNNAVSDYFKASGCVIRRYLNLGCFWSEHLKLIEDGSMASDFKAKLRDSGYREGMKLIAVFDSAFNDEFITNCKDGIEFLKGIHRLLEEAPDIFIVLKEKKGRYMHKKISGDPEQILGLYDILEKHPRCLCLVGGEDRWYSASETMAFSDLVISCPFTSTTVEALAAGKRAIWYDASGKFEGTFYDESQGLVAHSYGELKKRTIELLNMEDTDYRMYLEHAVKGRIEDYLDGKAVTRFRSLLAGADKDILENQAKKREEAVCR